MQSFNSIGEAVSALRAAVYSLPKNSNPELAKALMDAANEISPVVALANASEALARIAPRCWRCRAQWLMAEEDRRPRNRQQVCSCTYGFGFGCTYARAGITQRAILVRKFSASAPD
jgi:hypothetical protein